MVENRAGGYVYSLFTRYNWFSFCIRSFPGLHYSKGSLPNCCSPHPRHKIGSSMSHARRCLEIGPEAMPNLRLCDHFRLHWRRILSQIAQLKYLIPSFIWGVYRKGTNQLEDVVGIDIFGRTTFGIFRGFCTVPLWWLILKSLYCRVKCVLGSFSQFASNPQIQLDFVDFCPFCVIF